MNKLAKLLVLVLSVALLCGMLVFAIGAEEVEVAKVGDDKYTSFAEAVEAAFAEEGTDATVTLIADCEMDSSVTLQENLTVNLAGHKLTSTGFAQAFKVEDAYTLNIQGVGEIEVSGALVASETVEAAPVVNVIGAEGTPGIKIHHYGTSNPATIGGTKFPAFITTARGTYTFKNLDITSDVDATKIPSFGALIYTAWDSEEGADFVFDSVKLLGPATTAGSSNRALISIEGKGTLSISNSYMIAALNSIRLGGANGAESVDTEIVTIDNSLVYSTGSITDSSRLYFIDGYLGDYESPDGPWDEGVAKDAEGNITEVTKPSTKGTVNIKNSTVGSSLRLFCGIESCRDNSKIVLDNANVKLLGNVGSDTAYQVARCYPVVAKNGTKFSAVDGKIVGVNAYYPSNNNGVVTAEEGVRYSSNTIAMIPGGMTLVYDPAGDIAYPWVLKASSTVKSPDFSISYNMDQLRPTISFAPTGTNTLGVDLSRDERLVYRDNKSGYSAYTGNASDQQWNVKRGSVYAVRDGENNYMRYTVTPNELTPDATVRNFLGENGSPERFDSGNDDPFFVFGTPLDYDKSNTHVQTLDDAHPRRSVMVAEFDFGTDSAKGYPEIKIASQSRYGSNEGNAFTGNTLHIKNDGSVSNNLTDKQTVTLKGTNEWNRISMVAYTDSANANGIMYVYVNGQYAGYTGFYTVGSSVNPQEVFWMGIKISVVDNVNHVVNSSFCIDNVVIRAYTDYQVGETDGEDHKDASASYITSAPANKYISTVAEVAGIPYYDINDAIAAANAQKTVAKLTADVSAKVTASGIVYANGHTLTLESGSIGANVEYDGETPAVYTFDPAYDQALDFYWYKGEHNNDEQLNDPAYYEKVSVKIGQTPEPPSSISLAKVYDFESYTVSVQDGWIREFTEKVELLPITLADLNQYPDGVYMTPSFGEPTPLAAYVKNAAGVAIKGATSGAETAELIDKLADGETLVLVSDVELTASKFFTNTSKTVTDDLGNRTVNGVAIDNSYDEAELATMREIADKLAIDLNGHTISFHKASFLFKVGSNVELSVYSSQPGGTVLSVASQNSSGSYIRKGQRIFSISHSGNGDVAAEYANVFNAYVNVGKYGDIPGSNVTVVGGVLFEGWHGDNSTAINVDGIYAYRTYPDSTGAIMTRYYDGTITVSNSLIVAPTSEHVIDMKAYYYYDGKDQSKAQDTSDETVGRKPGYEHVYTPYVFIDNCTIINSGAYIQTNQDGTTTEKGSIISNCGDGLNVCLVFRNVKTNGRFNGSNHGEYRLRIAEGCQANLFRVGSENFHLEKGKYTIANVNIPLTVMGNVPGRPGVLKIPAPELNTSTGAIDCDKYIYITDEANASLIPNGAQSLILNTITTGAFLSEDVVKVYFATLDGEDTITYHTYAKGGNVNTATVSVPDVVGTALKLTHDGTWSANGINVQEDVTLIPGYEYESTVSGVKASFAVGNEIAVNFYIPYKYLDVLADVIVGESSLPLNTVDTDSDGTPDYVVATIKSLPTAINGTYSAALKFTEFEITVDSSVEIDFETYVGAVLADSENATYTASERRLVYYMAAYVNENCKYFLGAPITAVEELLTTYADAKGEAIADNAFAGAVESTNLGAAFTEATIALKSVPEFHFTLKDGFAGEITISVGEEKVATYNVSASSERVVVYKKLDLVSFDSALTITVNGTVGEDAVVIENGAYSFDTFAKYHTDNASASEESTECLAVLRALYEYVTAAK